MLATLLLAAEEAAEPDKTPFYIAASALVAWAVILSVVGMRMHKTFPASNALGQGLTLLTVVLVGATMFTAVLTG